VNDQPPPLSFDDDADLFAIPKGRPPATRTGDHPTSARAAARAAAEQDTIKAQVLRFAKDKGADGFIDDDLKAAFPDAPESSYRKRRTELTSDGLILDSGQTRQNRDRNAEVVWQHREFHVGPVKPRHMTQDQWDAHIAKLAARAAEVDEWATQLLREGRAPLGRGLADLAHALKLLRQ
jgi:hypothetical protein